MAKVFCPLPPGGLLSGFQVFKFLESPANGVVKRQKRKNEKKLKN